MSDTLTLALVFVTEVCCRCGMAFAVPGDFQERRRRDHQTYFCPAGHGQYWAGESDVEKLRRQLKEQERLAKDAAIHIEMERGQRKAAERELRTTRGQLTRARKRAAAGLCLCCNRTFANLQRHMESRHPDYGKEQP